MSLFPCLALLPLLFPLPQAGAPPIRHLVLLEHGPKWPANLDAATLAVLDQHKGYVFGLFADGLAELGGPAPDLAYGVLVLRVSERAEADRIAAADPAVQAGVFVADVRPFRCVSSAAFVPSPALETGELAPVRREVDVAAPLAEVWKAWSTPEGAQTFFAPRVELELAPLGKLEVLWMPDAPPGMRGAEDLRILAYAPERMLAFEWSAPPQFPRARPERTFVVVELEGLAPQKTRVTLLHQGFAEQAARRPELAQEWKDVRAYFDGAWGSVLGALETRFADGPLDWTAALAGAKPSAAKPAGAK